MAFSFRIPARPTPVGEMLKEEFLEPLGITQTQLAHAMGVGRKTVNELCNGRRRVTAETAFLLSKVFGNSPEFWMNLQYLNEVWKAQNDVAIRRRVALAKPIAAQRSQ